MKSQQVHVSQQLAIVSATVAAAFAIACSDSGDSGGTTSPTVTVSAPTIVGPNDPSPVTSAQPTLTVGNVTVSDGSTPTYHFQVATDSGFASIVVQASGIAQGSGQTSWQVSEPLSDGSFFWRARAAAGGVTGNFSSVGQFAITGGVGPNETIVVSDPLNGSTLATARGGGSFTANGWRVDNNGDFLRYQIPTVTDGYVQWQNTGLTPKGATDDSHMLFGMWDPTAGGFRANAFRVNVQKLWNNPHKPPFLRFRWISQGRLEDTGTNFTNWDPGVTYTWRVDWGAESGAHTARVFLDGDEIMQIRYTRTYAPNVHNVELGIEERNESVIDATYRNLLIVRRN